MTVVQTSLLSYRKLERIGSKQRMCYDVIKRLGGAANYDIAEQLKWPVNRVTPRVKELREFGFVQEAYKMLHPVTDRKVIYWEVTDGRD
jgi:hypothetical protein